MADLDLLLTSLAKGVVLVLGAFIVYLAYKGYRRNAARPLLYASLGFALLTAGTVVEGLLSEVIHLPLLQAVGAGTIGTILGFIVIIYSIYAMK